MKKTRYEELMEKAERCREASRRTRNFMSWNWALKAEQLENIARSLPIARAETEVK